MEMFKYKILKPLCALNTFIFIIASLISQLFFNESHIHTFIAIASAFFIAENILKVAKLEYIEYKKKRGI